MVRLNNVLGVTLVVFSLCYLIGCRHGDYKMQKRLYTTIDQITLSIDSCNHADSFFKERIDSISYKVHEYEEFYYNCFFPSLRLLDESTTEYVVQEFGVDKADISYFMIGLAHAKRNKIQLNDKSLLLVRAIAL